MKGQGAKFLGVALATIAGFYVYDNFIADSTDGRTQEANNELKKLLMKQEEDSEEKGLVETKHEEEVKDFADN